MDLKCAIIITIVSVLLHIQGDVVNAAASTRSVTNEDIREAILSVVHMIRATEDKLERHEFRERALGDHVKKAFLMLDKRLKSLDPVKGTVSRLDERLAAVETILMQKDERERAQLVKTHEAVLDIQQNLPGMLQNIKTNIIDEVSKSSASCNNHQTQADASSVANASLDKVHKELSEKLETMAVELGRVHNDSRRISDTSTDSLERVKKQLTNSEVLLQKYESKLAELNNRIPPLRTDKDERVERNWQTTVLTELETQRNNLQELTMEFNKLNAKINLLPTKEDLVHNANTTLDTMSNILNGTTCHEAVSNLSTSQDALVLQTRDQYLDLRAEIAGLAKVEQVMVQTADSVLDIKRRVEYGVHQVLLEVGGLVKAQAKSLNTTIHDRFDSFETVVLDGDSGALANLTAKIGAEIDQVWRQIGIMHQQMGASTDTLDRLRNQTDQYVNGSLAAMDGVQGKVGQITTRMADLDENLNYLMGKLSLVTQQFNQIKSGLGRALDEMRSSLATVKDKMPQEQEVDQGPGPHMLKPEPELAGNSIDDNDLAPN